MGLAGNARYLLSPVLAGLLLSVADIRLLLVLDIATFFLTVTTTLIVRNHLDSQVEKKDTSYLEDLKAGWQCVTGNHGLFILVLMSSLMTLFVGSIQILCEPMILDFTTSMVLGTLETICAMGMLVSGIYVGFKGIKKEHRKALCLSLCGSGIAMLFFGATTNLPVIVISGFFFFAMLPFANSCLDYLVRVHIPDELQGRAWGVIGFISQLGYVVAYALFGVAADTVASLTGLPVGRGAGITIMISGLILCLVALLLYRNKEVAELEKH